jgi:hypothetical protein
VEKSAFVSVTAVTLSLKQNQELVTSTSQNAAARCPILRTLIAKDGMQTVRQPRSAECWSEAEGEATDFIAFTAAIIFFFKFSPEIACQVPKPPK